MTDKKRFSLVPLGDKLIVRQDAAEERTEGAHGDSVLLPEQSKQAPCTGVVLAIGADVANYHVLKGMHVLFANMTGSQVPGQDEDVLLLRIDDIIAIDTSK